MKKITTLVLLFAAFTFLFSSCKKEDETVTKTINVSLNMNQSYSTQVAGGDADDVMQITTQAAHSSVSTLAPAAGATGSVFNYTPALDYVGTDEVQITNSEGDHHGHHMNGGGSCGGHHHDDNTIYIYKITINGGTVANNHGLRTRSFPTF